MKHLYKIVFGGLVLCLLGLIGYQASVIKQQQALIQIMAQNPACVGANEQ